MDMWSYMKRRLEMIPFVKDEGAVPIQDMMKGSRLRWVTSFTRFNILLKSQNMCNIAGEKLKCNLHSHLPFSIFLNRLPLLRNKAKYFVGLILSVSFLNPIINLNRSKNSPIVFDHRNKKSLGSFI